MSNPYSTQTIANYNTSPPPDDGTAVAANQLSWSKHKDKLADPIKTLTEAINAEALAAFGTVYLGHSTNAVSVNYTIVAADERRVVAATNSITITLLPVATAADGFTLAIFNAGTGTITIEADGSELINGALNYTLDDQYESVILQCNGATWRVLAEKRSAQTLTLPRGYFSGGTIANNSTDSDHDIDVAALECRGEDDDEDIVLSAITKQIDASWAAGTNQGGLSSSLTLSADTWYHLHAINVAGSSDVGFDTSFTAANLIADHSATAYQYINSVLTDASSNIIAFHQWFDTMFWDAAITDFQSTTSTAGTNRTISVPPDLNVEAIFNFHIDGVQTSPSFTNFYPPDIGTKAGPSVTANPGYMIGFSNNASTTEAPGAQIRCVTNTSRQVFEHSNVVRNFELHTFGWRILRGRLS